ncbi:hypothetical protein IT072_20740 (plasmid) [Leifsonia sp. ZF2019]|uniref:hypothetical protein n=1 Tax=Leifsonia sp. ZF2019 TaxID=2781978 RepID=UPI001CBEAD04|nr:hypothetical protein [Leifsonia sp. ZF2019]UAJ81774.1 hypothetical protein IT072_20740 [Leifsonia sp. ZF2019]
MSAVNRSVARLVDVELQLSLSPVSAPLQARTMSCPAAGGARPARPIDSVDGACAQLLTLRRTVITQ